MASEDLNQPDIQRTGPFSHASFQETWLAYIHYDHHPDTPALTMSAQGIGYIVPLGEGPADAWIVDVREERVVWYGHCSVAGPTAPDGEPVDEAVWKGWASPLCCGMRVEDAVEGTKGPHLLDA